jgi:hypothetical protein
MKALIAALLACAVAPGLAAAPQAPGSTIIDPAAHSLARLVLPDDQVGMEMDAGRTAFMQLTETAPDNRELEEAYPGIHQAMWSAMEPELRKSMTDKQPRDREKMARLYASMFSPADLAEANIFYSSPVGQKMIRAMYTETDMAPVMEQIAADPDAPISAEALKASDAAAKQKLTDALNEQEVAALMSFVQKVGMDKMRKVGEAVQRLRLEMLNEEDPELDARLDKLIEAATQQYIARKDAEAEAAS